MIFQDRADAGRRLAERLGEQRGDQVVVLALPRGGVPVGCEIARVLGAPLDLVLARKIGAPGHEEFAIGAVAEGGEMVVNAAQTAALGVDAAWLADARRRALEEIARRRRVYLGDRKPVSLQGKVAIVVDDGIATGATMDVALRAVRAQRPARIVMAVPVAAEEAIERLRPLVDDLVCLHTPPRFQAVGMHYRDFSQLRDQDVIAQLSANETDINRRR